MKKSIRVALLMLAAMAVMSTTPAKADPPFPTCDPCPKVR